MAGGLLHSIDSDAVDDAPVREHVRDFMRAAFTLHAAAVEHSEQTAQAAIPQPATDVETDWNLGALVVRVQRAMGTDAQLCVRLHDGSTLTGRPVRLTDGPKREDTTKVVELDGGQLVHLADVASIGPANSARRKEPRGSRLAACAHAFGYRGHCLTKSRRYSTTFKQLRADREAWAHEQILARSRDATQRALAEAHERIATFEWVGTGHVTAADHYYALAEHARARERRSAGRLEREMAITNGRWTVSEKVTTIGALGSSAPRARLDQVMMREGAGPWAS